MYVIVEGMPGTGKTTVAGELSRLLGFPYVKSLLSDTCFGSRLRELRKCGAPQLMEALYLGDLALDEIRVEKLLSMGGLIRDKSYASSLAHIRTHGYANADAVAREVVAEGYRAVAEAASRPDIVVFLTADIEEVRKRMRVKQDVSNWDVALCSDASVYRRQQEELLRELKSRYADRLFMFDTTALSVDSICTKIVGLVKGVIA